MFNQYAEVSYVIAQYKRNIQCTRGSWLNTDCVFHTYTCFPITFYKGTGFQSGGGTARGENEHARARARRCEAGHPSQSQVNASERGRVHISTRLLPISYTYFNALYVTTMETFIEGVRLQPCLWNPLHPDYREMHVKDEAWQCVVDHYKNSSIPNSKLTNEILPIFWYWKKYYYNTMTILASHLFFFYSYRLLKRRIIVINTVTTLFSKAMQILYKFTFDLYRIRTPL